jgi:hypothetical protein
MGSRPRYGGAQVPSAPEGGSRLTEMAATPGMRLAPETDW